MLAALDTCIISPRREKKQLLTPLRKIDADQGKAEERAAPWSPEREDPGCVGWDSLTGAYQGRQGWVWY